MGVQRNQIDKGVDVVVVIHVADGVDPKRRPAKVVEVMRAAARVRFTDDVGKTDGFRVVRFNHLELAPTTKKTTTTPKAVQDSRSARTSTPLQLVEAPSDDRPPRSPEDIEAWLEMGAELLAPLERAMADMDEEINALDVEREAIDEAHELAVERRADIRKRLSRLKAIVEAGKAAS